MTNRTAALSSITQATEDTTTHTLNLDYIIAAPNYNMTILTTLIPYEEDYYHTATTTTT